MCNTAERLRNLREKSHFSQHDIARKLHVTPALISAYERGERTPSPVKLIGLADIYHTTTDYILCRSNQDSSFLFIPLEGLSSKQIVLIRELIDSIRDT